MVCVGVWELRMMHAVRRVHFITHTERTQYRSSIRVSRMIIGRSMRRPPPAAPRARCSPARRRGEDLGTLNALAAPKMLNMSQVSPTGVDGQRRMDAADARRRRQPQPVLAAAGLARPPVRGERLCRT